MKPKLELNPKHIQKVPLNYAWAAGYIDGRGSFSFIITPKGVPFVQFRLRKVVGGLTMQRFAALFDLNTFSGKGHRGMGITVGGAPLHDLMKELWPYLSPERKREYADMKKRVNEWIPLPD